MSWCCQNIVPKFNVRTICRCCQLVDSDERIKLTTFCSFCNANICRKCFYNPKRILAFGIDIFKKFNSNK